MLIDGEPGYTQFKWANNVAQGLSFDGYDFYFTNGKNIGLHDNKIPTLGINWRHIYSPVKTQLFTFNHKKKDGYYSTIMNWKSHSSIQFNGQIYGQKDEEFLKFVTLPKLASALLEIAVSGKDVPIELLKLHGWSIKNAQLVTLSFDSFCQYLYTCRGEFSICKNVFISSSSGWFSDKSAAFLASGKPVVLQDTGFSRHLPTGDGLFAVNDVEEAREAIHKIESNYSYHCRKAREIACEYLEAKNVMNKFLDEVGI